MPEAQNSSSESYEILPDTSHRSLKRARKRFTSKSRRPYATGRVEIIELVGRVEPIAKPIAAGRNAVMGYAAGELILRARSGYGCYCKIPAHGESQGWDNGMFDRKTVFIIGAGAGVEISMPVGSQLSQTIADKTYIRHKDYSSELKTGDYAISNALRRVTQARGLDYNVWRAEACAIHDGIFETRSIDAYLNTHKDNEAVKIAGKLAIVQSILEAERNCDLYRDNDHWRNSDKVAKSWLPELFYVMQDGVGKADDIRNVFSNLAFVTFNYDRCLEHYLFHTIMKLYRLSEQETADIMTSLDIYRPYGQVGALSWELKGKTKVAFGGKDYRAIEDLAEEIKTFNEQVEDRIILQNIRESLNTAVRIVFLGFHYHKQNMDLMTVTDVSKTIRPKVIANAFDRSGPEISMIEQRIIKMLGEKRPAKSIEPYSNGCKALFKHYAATWM